MTKTFSIACGAIAVALVALAVFSYVSADSTATDFEAFSLGTINAQDGWTSAGAAGAGCAVYDHAVTTNSYGFATFGTKVLRISNAVTSGCFGDQTFSKSLINEAGETASTNGGMSGGVRQPHFEAQFDFASASTTQQPGLFLSVSPDRGDGSRMSYLGFSDEAAGIDVIFYDTPGTTNPATFSQTTVATGLSRTAVHTAKFVIDYVDGPSNDVVKIYVDGVLVHTGTTWENYFRFDTEAAAEQTPRTTDDLIFRTGGGAAPATAGEGYLIDNLSLLSGPTPSPTVKVVVNKFIDGAQATSGNANSSSFPMVSTTTASNVNGGVETGGNAYTLDVSDAYHATTTDMASGASYATEEIMSGAVVGASCSAGKPFALIGYSSGDTLALAQGAATSTTAPSFTGLTSDKYVIVWNKPCLPAPVNVYPADGVTLTTAAWDKADWTDVTDPFPPIVYFYESSNSSATSTDGSFVTPAYQSGALSVSEIPTPGTPAGTWYWHARAQDADGNLSPWSAATRVIVDNTPPLPTPPANACDLSAAPAGFTLQNGTSGNNSVTLAPNTMFVGGGGNDRVTGPDGNYIVCTGSGNDTITLGNGDSTIDAGSGNDTVTTGDGAGYIATGSGNDRITTGNGAHTIDAGSGNNTVTTGNGDQNVTTGSGNDKVTTGGGNDTISAGGGNNTVKSWAGNDTITTGGGNDSIDAGADTDSCSAGGGINTVVNCSP